MIDVNIEKERPIYLILVDFLIQIFIFSKFQTFFLHYLERYNLHILALHSIDDAYIPISGPNITKKGNPKGGIIG